MKALDFVYVGGLPRAPLADDSVTVGGMGLIASAMLQRLAARGHGVRVLSAVAAGDRTGSFIDLGPDVEVITYEMPRPLHSPARSDYFDNHRAQISAHLPAMLDRRSADFVLVGHQAYVGAFPEAIGTRATPWFVWVHNKMWPVITSADATVPDALAARMLGHMRSADVLIAVAEHVAEDLRTLRATSVATIPNAVDTRLFRRAHCPEHVRASLGLEAEDIVVVHVSTLKEVKRVGDLLRSAEQTLRGDSRVRYLIIGEGPHRAEIQTFAHTRGLSDRISLAGWLPRTEVACRLGIADIAIFPSAAEGMSLALLEALASGCAVIASDIRGAREVVTHDDTGLLYPVGEVEALTRHTLSLAEAPDRRRALSESGRRHVERHHGMDLMVNRFEALFEDLA